MAFSLSTSETLRETVAIEDWDSVYGIPRLSATLKRGLLKLGIAPRSTRFRAVFATVGALANTETLPAPTDSETFFWVDASPDTLLGRTLSSRAVDGSRTWSYTRDHED